MKRQRAFFFFGFACSQVQDDTHGSLSQFTTLARHSLASNTVTIQLPEFSFDLFVSFNKYENGNPLDGSNQYILTTQIHSLDWSLRLITSVDIISSVYS
jgi:hypothetical protein